MTAFREATDAAALAQAIEDNLTAKSLDLASLPGGAQHPGNPHWFTSGIPQAGFNGIVSAAFQTEALDAAIEAALAPFQATGTSLTWWVGPSTQPGNLGRHLQRHGFVHNRDMIGMAADLTHLPSAPALAPEMRFERVMDAATLDEWQPVFCEGFSVPPAEAASHLSVARQLSFVPGSEWRHYVLRQGQEVVAVSSLHLGAGIAGLYNVATRRTARQQGFGAALTLHTFAAAQALGYRLGTLQTTFPNALRLYHRLGFEVYCKIGVYQRSF